MRHFLTPAIILALIGTSATGAYAAEPANVGDTHNKTASEPALTKAKPVNTVCPVTGKAVDDKVPAVSIITGAGKEKITTLVAVASKHAASVLEKADADTQALYVKAALAGKMVEKGKIVDVPTAKPAVPH